MASIQELLKREEDQQGPSWQAELSFRDWKAGLEAARANYAGAPSNLKMSLLLRGTELQEATSWMAARARDLTPQQLSFIRKSIARSYSRAAEESHQLDQERKKRLKWWISFGATISAFILFLGLQFTLYDLWVKASGAVYIQQEATRTLPVPGKPALELVEVGVANASTGTVPPPASAPREAAEAEAGPATGSGVSPGQLALRAFEEAENDPARARLIALEALADASFHGPTDAELLPALAAIQTAASQQLALSELTADNKTVRASISRDGHSALLVTSRQTARWANLVTPGQGLAAVDSPIQSAESIVHLDGAQLAVSDGGDGIRVWPAGLAQPAAILRGHEAGITALAMSRDRRRIVTASWDETVRVWSVRTGRTDLYLRGHQGPALAAAFSADGTHIVTAGEDRTARVWNAADGRPVSVLTGHASTVETAQFDSTGARVLTTSLDGTARVWDAVTGQSISILRPSNGIVARAHFGTEGQRVAVLSNRGEITIWGLDGREARRSIPAGRSAPHTLQLGGRGDGLLLTLSSAGLATLTDIANGAIVGLFQAGKEDRIVSVEFMADGREIIAITERNRSLRWIAHHSVRDLVAEARQATPRCLSSAERSSLGLDPALPKWCLELGKSTPKD